MDFRVLGPLEAYAGGALVDLGRRQERRLLGLLLLSAGRPVPADRLVELLWEERPPADARAALHTHVARLRGRLTPLGVALETRASGYLLGISRESVATRALLDALGLPADRIPAGPLGAVAQGPLTVHNRLTRSTSATR